jgi:hypothetical protein
VAHKELSLLEAISAKHRSKCSPVTGNGDSRQIAEKLLKFKQTNRIILNILTAEPTIDKVIYTTHCEVRNTLNLTFNLVTQILRIISVVTQVQITIITDCVSCLMKVKLLPLQLLHGNTLTVFRVFTVMKGLAVCFQCDYWSAAVCIRCTVGRVILFRLSGDWCT